MKPKTLRGAIAGCLILALGLCACTDWDDFKKYQAGGEIVYPGKGDTVLVASGRDRMQLHWVLSADPRVTKYRLFWNNHADSLEAAVSADVIGDTLQIMVDPLPEGSYNFELFSYDDKGNKSVPMRFNGRTYGNAYESGLLNRTIGATSYDDSLKVLDIQWNQPDTVNVSTELRYLGRDAKEKTIQVKPEAESSKLTDWKPGTTLRFRSTFKPDRKSIDVFTVTRYDTLTVRL